jgi:hypothetical protein
MDETITVFYAVRLERDFLSRCRCWSMDSSSDVNHSRIVVTKKAAAVTATLGRWCNIRQHIYAIPPL